MNFSISPLAITRGQFIKLSATAFKLTNAPTALPQDTVFTWSWNIDNENSGYFTSSRKDESGRALGTVDSFTMADLKAGYISFLVIGHEAPKIQFYAQVAGESASTELVSSFKWAPLAPAFDFDNGPDIINAELSEGQKLTLTRDMLQLKNSDWRTTESADYLGNISAKITKVSGGSFLLNGSATKSFTLDDVHRGIVQFQHDGKNAAPLISLQLGDSKGLNSQSYNLKFSSFRSVDDAPLVTAKPLSLTYKFTAAKLIKHPGVGKNVVDGITFWDEAPWEEVVPAQVIGSFVALKSALTISDEETKNAAEIRITVQEANGVHLFKKLSAGGYIEVSSFFASELGSIFLQGESGSSHKLKLSVQAGNSSAEILVPIRNVDAGYADYGAGLVKITDNLAPKLLSFDLGSFDGSPLTLNREMIPLLGQSKEKSYDEIQGKYVYTGNILDLDDADDYTGFSDLVFQVAPSNGAFFLNGVSTASFTGAELEAGAVSFLATKPGILPSFSVVIKDSFGASTGKVTGQLDYSPAPQLSVKSPLSITEGGRLKLTPAMLMVNAPAADLVGINIHLSTWEDYDLARQNSDHELNENAYRSDRAWFTVADRPGKLSSFTYAELAAGKVSLVHNGSEFAPSINLIVSNTAGKSSLFSAPVGFKSVNDAPLILTEEKAPWGDTVYGTGLIGEPRYIQLNPGEAQNNFEGENRWVAFDDELTQTSSDFSSSEFSSDSSSSDFYSYPSENRPFAAKLLIYKVSAVQIQNIKFEKNIASDGLDSVWQTVTQFTQGDLDAGRILTSHTGPLGSTATFSLVVTDLQGLSSAPVNFQTISHVLSNNYEPVITAGAISLKEGGSVTLTSAMLNANDADPLTADQSLRFSAQFNYNGQDENSVSPLHFVKASKWVDSFTLADVKAGKISLIHDGSENSATLVMSVSDGAMNSSLELTPAITWVNDQAPVIQAGTFTVLTGQSLTLTRAHLNASDADSGTEDSALRFNISAVTGGSFKKNGLVTTSFTLADIDDGLVSFSPSGTTAPTFSIMLSDGLNNSAGLPIKGFLNDMIVSRPLASDSLSGTIKTHLEAHQLVALDNGNFVAAWGRSTWDTSGGSSAVSHVNDGIYAQVLDGRGTALGTAIKIASWDTSSTDFDISSTGDGFLVAWASDSYADATPNDGNPGIHRGSIQAQKFTATGVKSGLAIAVDSAQSTTLDEFANVYSDLKIVKTATGLLFGYNNNANFQFSVQEADNTGKLLNRNSILAGTGEGHSSMTVWNDSQALIVHDGIAKNYSVASHAFVSNSFVQDSLQNDPESEFLRLPNQSTLLWSSGTTPTLYNNQGSSHLLTLPAGFEQESGYVPTLSADGSKIVFSGFDGHDGSVLIYDLSSSSFAEVPNDFAKLTDIDALLPLADGGFLMLWSQLDIPDGNPDESLDTYHLSRYDASGHNLGAVYGSSAADSFTGNSEMNLFADIGSGDSVYAGAGDDGITITSTAFNVIDGGAGDDVLSSSLDLNLTQVTDNKLLNIESIELKSGALLTLNATDVYAINSNHTLTVINSDTSKAFFQLADSGWIIDDQGHYTKNGATLIMDGDVSQVTTLSPHTYAEFRVNTYTNSDQFFPAIASLSDGGTIVTWTSYGQDGAYNGTYAQRYDSQGNRFDSEFKVNTYTTSYQGYSSVSALSNGGFVITWFSNGQDGNGDGIFAQRYDVNNQPVGLEFRVNTFTAGHQNFPVVTGLANGAFAITWMSNAQDGSGYGIYARRYNADGTTANEFKVNTSVANDQMYPAISSLADSGFLVSWQSANQDGSGFGIYAQRYTASGATIGSEFKVNTNFNSDQSLPSITSLNDGGFIVTWESNLQDGSSSGIYAQRYAANGIATGSEFKVNTYTTGYQSWSSVTALSDGGFFVAWASGDQDGSGAGIYAQRYSANGATSGSEFKVNTFITSDQNIPAVTALIDGGVLITWVSTGEDGSGAGIYAQRYAADGSKTGGSSWAGLIGTEGVVGTPKNDILTSIGNGDSVRGDAGDDIFTLNSTDFNLIDGGEGTDTLKLSASLDLTILENQQIKNIEVIDLGSNIITLKMDLADVLAISDSNRTVKITGTVGTLDNEGKITGAGTWDHEAGWAFGGSANGFETYTNGVATVLVQNELNVI